MVKKSLTFQFTASYEADHLPEGVEKVDVVFQFTASYEADPGLDNNNSTLAIFQFTASYEADLLLEVLHLEYYSFNSQPHTRLTNKRSTKIYHQKVFQFTASYEADRYTLTL